MAAPAYNMPGQNVQGYDPIGAVLYTLPDTGATLNVNTLPESVVDQLIAKYGTQAPLVGRKQYLQQTREQAAGPKPLTDIEQYAKEAQGIGQGLAERLRSLYGQAFKQGVENINQAAAPNRSKLMAEQAALGRLTSPVSSYNVNQFDQGTNNAIGNLASSLAGQQASQEGGLSSVIAGILGDINKNTLSNSQFNKTLEFNQNSLLNDINQAHENRGLTRFLGNTKTESGSGGDEDLLGGAISGGLAGASAGSKAGPWGALLGGLGGAGLGAYSKTRR